jgi:acetyl-CoA synthetase (ADP-forming)
MIDYFFYPKSIAVIGATANPKKFGNAVTINILKDNHPNINLFLISPNRTEILGVKCYASILDVKQDIDIAIILVPAKIVQSIIDECIEKQVKGIIIITAGFSEIDEKGRQEENLIAQKCEQAEIRVMGPNCVGIQNIDLDLNASFIQKAPLGNISMISQSGSFGCASFYALDRQGLGISKFANIGNNIDVSFVDILDFFHHDRNTEIIGIYMETIKHGKSFLNKLSEIIPSKPIILLKGGRTSIGMKAASSHTGSLTSNYQILKVAMKQAGITLCENATDFITALKTFSILPLPKGKRIGVLTNSGGSSVLFSDKLEEYNLGLASFSKELKEKMKRFLIPLVKIINPLDMIGGAAEEEYYNITKLMLEEESLDIIVSCVVIPPFLEMDSDEHYRGIIRAWNDTNRSKPLIPLIFFGESFEGLNQLSKDKRAPIYYSPDEAAYAVKILVERANFLSFENRTLSH